MDISFKFLVFLLLIFTLLVLWFVFRHNKRDARGFNKNGIHKNGTAYDAFGYDIHGFDKYGYDPQGYNYAGYDRTGFNRIGYNSSGKNRLGQYNRRFDTHSYKDGFFSLQYYPIILTTHAKERMAERLHVKSLWDAEKLALEAYSYGKSKRQVKQSSAAIMESIENQHENGILLIYNSYIYVFSADNKLITVYQNDRIPL